MALDNLESLQYLGERIWGVPLNPTKCRVPKMLQYFRAKHVRTVAGAASTGGAMPRCSRMF